jgi:predicted CXXCH cytochrome family protein
VPAFAQDCLTTGCHQSLADQENPHQPVAEGECLACHTQKNPGHPSMTGKNFTLSDSVANLCYQCHELEQKGEMHPPITGGDCLACHNSHGSANRFLLKAPMPILCLECHEEVLAASKAKVKHAAIYRENSCGVCHTGHSSHGPDLLLAPEKELCLSCHGQDDFSRSKPLRNIGREIEGKAHLHGPVAEGKCSPCHAPHGSPFFRLLREDYPSGPYAFNSKSYPICFECHDRSMLDSPKATDMTGFRSSSQNLHYVHAIDHQKGRVCTICHASHGSANHGLIKEKGTPFGDWIIPINFKPTSTGGSCAPGCHTAAQYDRTKP